MFTCKKKGPTKFLLVRSFRRKAKNMNYSRTKGSLNQDEGVCYRAEFDRVHPNDTESSNGDSTMVTVPSDSDFCDNLRFQMLETKLLFGGFLRYVGYFLYLKIGHQHLKIVTNANCHQHLSPTLM